MPTFSSRYPPLIAFAPPSPLVEEGQVRVANHREGRTARHCA
jgi:hypothetical protein